MAVCTPEDRSARSAARRQPWRAVPIVAIGVALVVLAATALDAGSGRTVAEAALDGGAVPVLVSVSPAAAAGTVTFPLSMAPGEARKGEAITAVFADGRPAALAVRVAQRSPDGSAARIEVHGKGFGAGDNLVLVRPPRLADPTGIAPRTAAGSASVTAGVTVFGGAVAALVEAALWHGDLAAQGSSKPPWWDQAAARFPVGTDPADLDGRIRFVQVAYAEKGRPQKAVRLFEEIADDAAPASGGTAAPNDPARLRSWLKVCHEIAHLYDGALQDDARALGWALRCAGAPLADPAEERQNRIAAGLAAARAVEGLGRRPAAVALYRLLARDLLLDPDPYGTLLLPQIFLHVGDAELSEKNAAASEAAYRAAAAAAGRLPEGTPSNFLAPGSVARAALRRLGAQGLAFSRVADGTYEGEAYGYNAPIGVRLTFQAGRCTELHVTDLGDKRPLDAYRVLPDRILESQSLEVDAVTGATVTSRAILSAATEAAFQGEGSGAAERAGKAAGGDRGQGGGGGKGGY